MRTKDILIVLFLLFVLYILLNDKREQTQLVLPDNNTLKYVLIYADWCPACKRLKPLWEEIKKSNKNIKFYDINTDNYDIIKNGKYIDNIPPNIQNNVSKLNIQTIPHIYQIDDNDKMNLISIKQFMELKTN